MNSGVDERGAWGKCIIFLHMISQWFIRKTCPIVRYIVEQYEMTKSVTGLRSRLRVLRFSNHNVLGSFCRHPGNLRKSLQRGRHLLTFGSRNWRTKSRKERNYAPRLANSWLRHCLWTKNLPCTHTHTHTLHNFSQETLVVKSILSPTYWQSHYMCIMRTVCIKDRYCGTL